jgi:hypothetical protein
MREEKGLSILHEVHDTREFDFARYALRCCHERAVEVGVSWETKWCEHRIVPEIRQGQPWWVVCIHSARVAKDGAATTGM